MFKCIKKQILLLWSDWAVGMALIFGGFLFGMLLLKIIVVLDPTMKYYVPLGTILAVFCALLALLVTTSSELVLNFNLQVSMGVPRKMFYVSHILANFLPIPVFWGEVLLLGAAEKRLLPILYGQMEKKMELLRPVGMAGIPVGILCVLVAWLGVTLVMRLGQKAAVCIWGLWMAACMGIPRIIEAAETDPDSLPGKVGFFFITVPLRAWNILGVLLGVISVLVSYRILARRQVDL